MKVLSLQEIGILSKITTRNSISQEGGSLNFLRQLITAGLPLMKSVLTQLAKSVFILSGLPAGTSAAQSAMQKKIYASGRPLVVALRTTA